MRKPLHKRVWLYVTAAIILVGGLMWFMIGFLTDTAHVLGRNLLNHVWLSWLFPNGWNLLGAAPFFWWVVSAVALGTLLLLKGMEKETHTGYYGRVTERHTISRWWYTVTACVAAALVIVSGVGFWNIDKSAAIHYTADNQAMFVVDSLDDVPSVLRKVERSDTSIVNITEGDITFDWERRIASATGAVNVMKRTGGATINTELMSETIAYIYDDSSQGGAWTAIRNGINRQDIYSISTWSTT